MSAAVRKTLGRDLAVYLTLSREGHVGLVWYAPPSYAQSSRLLPEGSIPPIDPSRLAAIERARVRVEVAIREFLGA